MSITKTLAKWVHQATNCHTVQRGVRSHNIYVNMNDVKITKKKKKNSNLIRQPQQTTSRNSHACWLRTFSSLANRYIRRRTYALSFHYIGHCLSDISNFRAPLPVAVIITSLLDGVFRQNQSSCYLPFRTQFASLLWNRRRSAAPRLCGD